MIPAKNQSPILTYSTIDVGAQHRRGHQHQQPGVEKVTGRRRVGVARNRASPTARIAALIATPTVNSRPTVIFGEASEGVESVVLHFREVDDGDERENGRKQQLEPSRLRAAAEPEPETRARQHAEHGRRRGGGWI